MEVFAGRPRPQCAPSPTPPLPAFLRKPETFAGYEAYDNYEPFDPDRDSAGTVGLGKPISLVVGEPGRRLAEP